MSIWLRRLRPRRSYAQNINPKKALIPSSAQLDTVPMHRYETASFKKIPKSEKLRKTPMAAFHHFIMKLFF